MIFYMKKVLILLIIATIVVAGCFVGYFSWQKAKEAKFLSTNPQTAEAYALIQKREIQLKKDKNNYDALMSVAFSWKGIGEVTKNNEYLKRAAATYGEVIKRWGNKAYLPFLNRANVYIELKEYARAEQDFKIALEIDRGEQNLYIALVDLYRGYMKKDDKVIKAVYKQGLTTVVGGGNLVLSYAGYLKEIEEYAEAIKYYKMLKQAYPANTGYGEIIKELEAKVPKT